MNVKPGFKQVGHKKQVGLKKQNLEPVKEETFERMDKMKCTQLHFEGKGIVIPVTVNEIAANSVVDTGADATVISSDFACVAGIDTRGWKMACLLKAENGADMTAFGGVTATLLIGSHTTSCLSISPIRDSVLIGMDLLFPLIMLYTRGREIFELERRSFRAPWIVMEVYLLMF